MKQIEYIKIMEKAIKAIRIFNENGMIVYVTEIQEVQTQRKGDKEPEYIMNFRIKQGDE